jgi:hypothetical protein
VLGFADVDAGSVRVADLEWNKARGQLRGLQVACPVERITCCSTQALSRNVAVFISRRVSSQGLFPLYASSEDLALVASKSVHGAQRAGDSGPGLVLVPGIETIDATGIDTSL